MSDPVKIRLRPLGRTVEVKRGAALQSVLHTLGVEFPCGGRGRCAGCRVRVVDGSLPLTRPQAEILTARETGDGWRLACHCKADSNVTLEIGQWETVILADHSSFDFTPRDGLGIAGDLGTTTLVAQLLDLRTGRVLAVRTALNPQAVHGGDVMSRIQFAIEGGGTALTGEIRRGIGTLFGELTASSERVSDRIEGVVVVGNTVMHHLFCGIDVEPLSHSPFETGEKGPRRFAAGKLGWKLAGDPAVRFLPCLGSFVGSDILAGILATRMHEREAPLILVDLGTNGEIVIGNRERMICASTAAGPAFEGGRISMGMRATTGAISEVTVDEGRLQCRVMGDAAPRGICGSGLVDAVAGSLELGLIDPSGRLTTDTGKLDLAPPVTLTQGDVRELQLAKGAIAAGIRILRKRFGRDADHTTPVYLAGAFGNYVNRARARRIGLIDAPIEKIEPAGNTALLGAKLALFEDDDDFGEIRGRVEHLSLATDPEFQEIFIAETAFPAPEA